MYAAALHRCIALSGGFYQLLPFVSLLSVHWQHTIRNLNMLTFHGYKDLVLIVVQFALRWRRRVSGRVIVRSRHQLSCFIILRRSCILLPTFAPLHAPHAEHKRLRPALGARHKAILVIFFLLEVDADDADDWRSVLCHRSKFDIRSVSCTNLGRSRVAIQI